MFLPPARACAAKSKRILSSNPPVPAARGRAFVVGAAYLVAFIGADTGAEFTDDGSPTVFLSKPFQPATLLRTLHNLLDSAVTPRGLSA